jgi:ParB family chromosome partitioning protein
MRKAATTNDAFAGLSDMLAGGFDTGLTSEGAQRQMFRLEDIEVEKQVREEFEDAENSLHDLGDSLMKEQIQPILLRRNRPGRIKPYLLVVGGRRYAAAELKLIPELWGDYRPEMTDAEADRIQLAENIQRKNLTQIEEAKRIQRDLDTLGSVDAVLAKHHKSRAWLSKITALLNLPEQAKRLVKEDISADLEVINTVKTIEKVDPNKARELVDELKQTRGRANARDKVAQVKAAVKPSKKDKKDTRGRQAPAAEGKPGKRGEAEGFAPAKRAKSTGAVHEDTLARAYVLIFEAQKSPKTVLDMLAASERAAVDAFLNTFYEAGRAADNTGRTVIEGFRNGGFSGDGVGGFALVAYLQGADKSAPFSTLNIFGCMKP